MATKRRMTKRKVKVVYIDKAAPKKRKTTSRRRKSKSFLDKLLG